MNNERQPQDVPDETNQSIKNKLDFMLEEVVLTKFLSLGQSLNKPLHVKFVDFSKAFDSIHKQTLWKIIRRYGIPEKLITMITKFSSLCFSWE